MPMSRSPGPLRPRRQTPVARWKRLLPSTGTKVVMFSRASLTSVETAVPAAKHFIASDTPAATASQATRLREASSPWQARPFGYRSGQALPLQRPRFRGESGFTLVELLVSIGVLAILVLLATQL